MTNIMRQIQIHTLYNDHVKVHLLKSPVYLTIIKVLLAKNTKTMYKPKQERYLWVVHNTQPTTNINDVKSMK